MTIATNRNIIVAQQHITEAADAMCSELERDARFMTENGVFSMADWYPIFAMHSRAFKRLHQRLRATPVREYHTTTLGAIFRLSNAIDVFLRSVRVDAHTDRWVHAIVNDTYADMNSALKTISINMMKCKRT